MIETDLSSTTIEEMQEGENRDKIFRLVWVQNLDMSDYRFRVLFKHDKPDGKYLMAKIAPEQLFMYAPGAFYINGQRLKNPPAEGEYVRLSLETLERNSIKKIGEAFSDDLYDLRHGRVTYSRSQYCVMIETETHELIFPCFVLGATYYFTSASMCRQLFAQTLEGLYKHDSIDLNPATRHAKIHLKTNAADADAADIIRFATNKNAKKQWKAIVNNLRGTQKEYNRKREGEMNVPLIADFPVAAKFGIEARALIRFYPGLHKKKVLVLEIMKEESPFEFEKITIERINMPPRTVDVKRRAKMRRTTRVVTIRVPSSGLASIDIKNTEPPKNIHKSDMEIVKEYTGNADRKGIVVSPVVTGEGETDIGLSESANDGDPGVRHGEVKAADPQEIEVRYKNSFTLADFQKMVEPFAKEADIQNFQMVGPLSMPQRAGENIKGSLWEFLDKEHKRSRKFLRVTFIYKLISVCLIEIDHCGLPSTTSTYVLVPTGKRQISHGEVWEFLDMFVNRETIEAIGDHFRGQEFMFFGKKHPIGKKDELYRMWRHALLKRIEALGQGEEN